MEVWSEKRPIASISVGTRLRIVAAVPFEVAWTLDDPSRPESQRAVATGVSVWYSDVDAQRVGALKFTLRTSAAGALSDREHIVAVEPRSASTTDRGGA
jgi:hypothetical protein